MICLAILQPPEPGLEGWGPGPRCSACERRSVFVSDHMPSPSITPAAIPSSSSAASVAPPLGGDDEAAAGSGPAGPPPPGPSAGETQALSLRAGPVRASGGPFQSANASSSGGNAAAQVSPARLDEQAALLRGLAESYVW